jgi:hypothetical protein
VQQLGGPRDTSGVRDCQQSLELPHFHGSSVVGWALPYLGPLRLARSHYDIHPSQKSIGGAYP